MMPTCPCCGGLGSIRDDRDIGAELRALCLSIGITLREWAKTLKLSPSYISDLELGRRRWNAQLVHKYAILRAPKL